MSDIIRQHGAEFLRSRGGGTSREIYLLKALASCRTAAMGGHIESCDQCDYRRQAYNSCRDRHCPKCQGAARAAWLEARREELLPVPYYHLVFTLPRPIAELARQNPKLIYDLLFRCSAGSLEEIAADPRHLGAEIGFVSVLHTWGQNLQFHPHVHCIVPGGGISPDGSRWVFCPENFFLPVRVLGRLFRGKFLAHLREAYDDGRLSFRGALAHLSHPVAFAKLIAEGYKQEWVVYAKPPAGGPEQVLKYLARYTHRVAISNDRLLQLQDDQVTFRWKNYAAHGRWQTMTLHAVEFLRRFFMHVLPRGFVRLRHYGFLANRHREAKLSRCRELLASPQPVPDSSQVSTEKQGCTANMEESERKCPACKQGKLLLRELRARPTSAEILYSWPFDTS